jgi:hypothetical protein
VHSNAGLPASEVAVVAAEHFPVRSTATAPLTAVTGGSKLDERVRTTSRLAAQRLYRVRRGLAGP